MNTTEIEKNRVLLVGVLTSTQAIDPSYDIEYDLLELSNLCESCNMEVIDKITQNLDEINSKSYVGKGKLEEIKMMINSYDINTIVCNDELSPAQIENLEKELEVTIFDRTYVILKIFKSRAKTKEAIVQVEIASLKYMLPRLTGMRKGLSRQSGGKNKGKGETQLELDRRRIEARISFLNNELKELTKERQFQREKRKKNNMLIVSLVGYTNSGKSSTMNAILTKYAKDRVLEKSVFEKDMLFATLETSTRFVKLNSNLEFLLTDTVGFINKLPHTLIEAFKSTLEEIKEADLIVHVVDASNAHYNEQVETTNHVLNEIGAKDIPVLYAFNKMDKLTDYFYVPSNYECAVRYSAKNDIDELVKSIEVNLFKDYKLATFVFPYDKGNLVSLINEKSKIVNTKYKENIIVEAYVSEYLYNYLQEYLMK